MSVHRCPVCYGRTVVPSGFYSEDYYQGTTCALPESCRSCGGRGVIICPDIVEPVVPVVVSEVTVLPLGGDITFLPTEITSGQWDGRLW